MFSIARRSFDGQQGISAVHAIVSGKRTVKMNLHHKDALYLTIVEAVPEKCNSLKSMIIVCAF
jgi:hypothetical protein